MKSIHLGLSGHRFDDQYTFDLQGYITVHDFNSTMCLFNEAVRQHPPPGHKGVWCTTLVSTWVLSGVTIYTMWAYLLTKGNPFVLLVIPVVVLITTILWVWRYRYLQRVFQCSLVELCSRINATENIRGINYRLVKHGHHDAIHSHNQHQRSALRWHASYSLVIEFDDRYRALQDPDMMSVPTFYPPPPPLPVHHTKRYSCSSNTHPPCLEKQ